MSPSAPAHLDGSAHPLQQLGGPSTHMRCALLGVPELVQALVHLGEGSGVLPSSGCLRTKARVYWCSMCFSPLRALVNASFKKSGGGKSGKPWPRFTVE